MLLQKRVFAASRERREEIVVSFISTCATFLNVHACYIYIGHLFGHQTRGNVSRIGARAYMSGKYGSKTQPFWSQSELWLQFMKI